MALAPDLDLAQGPALVQGSAALEAQAGSGRVAGHQAASWAASCSDWEADQASGLLRQDLQAQEAAQAERPAADCPAGQADC